MNNEVLTFEQLTAAQQRRKKKTVHISALDGDIVLQELMATDVLYLSRIEKPEQIVKARVAMTLAAPALPGNTRDEKIAALETQVIPNLPEGAWDEIVGEVGIFRSEYLFMGAEEMRKVMESVPELWRLAEFLLQKGGWLDEGSDLPIGEAGFFMELFRRIRAERDEPKG